MKHFRLLHPLPAAPTAAPGAMQVGWGTLATRGTPGIGITLAIRGTCVSSICTSTDTKLYRYMNAGRKVISIDTCAIWGRCNGFPVGVVSTYVPRYPCAIHVQTPLTLSGCTVGQAGGLDHCWLPTRSGRATGTVDFLSTFWTPLRPF